MDQTTLHITEYQGNQEIDFYGITSFKVENHGEAVVEINNIDIDPGETVKIIEEDGTECNLAMIARFTEGEKNPKFKVIYKKLVGTDPTEDLAPVLDYAVTLYGYEQGDIIEFSQNISGHTILTRSFDGGFTFPAENDIDLGFIEANQIIRYDLGGALETDAIQFRNDDLPAESEIFVVGEVPTISYAGQQGIECVNFYQNNPLFYPPSTGLTMSPDGTKLFAVLHNGNNEGFTRDSIMQFNLSTPWDLTTMSTKVGNTPSLNSFPGYNEQSPYGAMFSPDGLNLYVAGNTFNRVYRYTLSLPYIVSTAVAHSSFGTGLTGVSGLSFSQDGSYMFVTNGSPAVTRFLLNTPWDVTTAVANGGNMTVSGGSSLYFTPDGLTLFTYSNAGVIYKYYLAIPWVLSSYIKTENSPSIYPIVPDGGIFNGIYLSADGKRFFFSNYTGVRVKAVELSHAFTIKAKLIY